MLDHLESAVKEVRNVFVGTGTPSRTLEQMIPLLGIGRENRVLEVAEKLMASDTETGLRKGKEVLQVYSKFVTPSP
jgi:hypothetical protein